MCSEIRNLLTGDARRSHATSPGPGNAAKGGKSQPAAAAPPAGEKVTLTETARKLSGLAAGAAGGPGIDEARVAELRAAIESGRYQPDPAAIAAALLDIEQPR